MTTVSFSIYSVPKKGCSGTKRDYHPQTSVSLHQKKRDTLRGQANQGARHAAMCLLLGTGECVLGGGWMGYKYYSAGEINPAGALAVGSGITTLGFGALKLGNIGLRRLQLTRIPSDEELIAKYEVKQPQRMVTLSKKHVHIGPPSAEGANQELEQVVVALNEEE